MCDYCDCRSHPQIASLSADHDVLLELLGGLVRAVDADDHASALGIVERLNVIVGDHAGREERGVFAALRRVEVADSYLDAFERDHELVHDLLARSMSDDWRQPARALALALGEHIAREESDLFPASHQLLTPEQWVEIDVATAAVAP